MVFIILPEIKIASFLCVIGLKDYEILQGAVLLNNAFLIYTD